MEVIRRGHGKFWWQRRVHEVIAVGPLRFSVENSSSVVENPRTVIGIRVRFFIAEKESNPHAAAVAAFDLSRDH